mmetsp:Transcript_57721/g.171739  ORF Transcript_57721/g.171739 Transcript_57721/m.171739 type:complete len:282 (+) Transcript_57721:609-1454(+)
MGLVLQAHDAACLVLARDAAHLLRDAALHAAALEARAARSLAAAAALRTHRAAAPGAHDARDTVAGARQAPAEHVTARSAAPAADLRAAQATAEGHDARTAAPLAGLAAGARQRAALVLLLDFFVRLWQVHIIHDEHGLARGILGRSHALHIRRLHRRAIRDAWLNLQLRHNLLVVENVHELWRKHIVIDLARSAAGLAANLRAAQWRARKAPRAAAWRIGLEGTARLVLQADRVNAVGALPRHLHLLLRLGRRLDAAPQATAAVVLNIARHVRADLVIAL